MIRKIQPIWWGWWNRRIGVHIWRDSFHRQLGLWFSIYLWPVEIRIWRESGQNQEIGTGIGT